MLSHELDKTGSKGVNVLDVQRVGRLVKSENTAVLAERIGKCQADDD